MDNFTVAVLGTGIMGAPIELGHGDDMAAVYFATSRT